MHTRAFLGLLGASVVLWASAAGAATLKVGPGLAYENIPDAMPDAKPGDVIEVQGGHTYPGMIWLREDYGGTKDKPVIIRGTVVNGKRPVLSGVGSGEFENIILLLNSNHVVMESFEVIGDGGDSNYCVVHKADDVVMRDFVIHNCLHQGGLVGNDFGSGSLLVEYSEFYQNGNGTNSHQIYMATDEEMYPGSVFRIQFSYVHDGLGGNNVRSRAERNEIYSNWVEGAFYHELDLIGPIDKDDLPIREDSDIVGNVLIKKKSPWRIARVGNDGDGNTKGRYRFANNTMILDDASTTAISLQGTVETLEMYNNVIFGSKGGFEVYDVNEQIGPDTVHFGANNWVLNGTASIPKEWTGTLTGAAPGFVNLAQLDLRPAASSPLLDKGTTTTVSSGPLGMPKPLLLPAYHPPQHVLLPIGKADPRTNIGAPDIGAFEANAGSSAGSGGSAGSAGQGGSAGKGGGSGAGGSAGSAGSGGKSGGGGSAGSAGKGGSGGSAGSAGSAGSGGSAGKGGSGGGSAGSDAQGGQGGEASGAGGKGGSASAGKGGSAQAGKGGAGGGSGQGGSSDAAAPASDDGGCGCRSAGGPGPGGLGFAVGAVVLALARRRRS